MAIVAGQTTVTTSAAAVVTNSTADHSAVEIEVASGGQDVFVGPSGVATTTGLRVAPASRLKLVLAPGESLYGIVAATTQVVSYISVG